MHGKISDAEEVSPFDPDLTIFSYQHKRSKPDQYLFELLKDRCSRKYDISLPMKFFLWEMTCSEICILRIVAGFKTALFAGDSKSLRLRKGKPETDRLDPDYIITDLKQLHKIIV